MQVLMLTVAYNGADFHGFARQPGLSTVQGEIESALSLVLRREVQTVCAGRTDAGVHALGQRISFDLAPDDLSERSLPLLLRSLNSLVPEKIALSSPELRPEGFSARFDAKTREYRYRIIGGDTPPVFLAPYAWWVRGADFDIEAMREAAALLIGEHDFKSFCLTASAKDKNTVRELFEISIEPEEQMGEECLCVKVVGNAFLHSMVRTIMGTLVDVGLGRREPAWVTRVLEACDRAAAGETAPACGLVFQEVRY